MKKIIFTIIFCFFILDTAAQDKDFFQYVFPKSGSELVSPQTTLIFRLHDRWQGIIGPDQMQVKVTGESSATHQGKLFLAADQQTVIFKPAQPFAENETVSVEISLAYPAYGPAINYQFHTSKSQNPDHAVAHKKSSINDITSENIPFKISGEMNVINGVAVPGDFPGINVDILQETAEGKIFLANGMGFPNPYMVIFENNGTPYYYQRLTYSAAQDFKVQPTGTLTIWVPSKFLELDSNYTYINTYRAGHGYTTDDHELQLLPNGNYLIIAVDYQIIDMSQLVEDGNPRANVRGYHMQELDRDGNVLFEWRCWDHFNILDALNIDLTASSIDYVHMNAIAIDYDGHFLISSRNLSEITKINRQTGDIIWRLGGNNNQFLWTNDAYGISYQHDIRPVPNQPDHYTVFDNGSYHSPRFSRALELVIDTANMSVTKIWEYRHTPDRYSPWRGNVQRLPNGNTLINWAYYILPKATEVTPAGEIVYEMDIIEDTWVYRTFRSKWRGSAKLPYLLAEAYTDKVVLIFNKFGDEAVDYYVIYGGQTLQPTTVIDTTTTTWSNLTDLENHQIYYFRVKAIVEGQETDYSNTVNLFVRYVNPGSNLLLNGNFSQQQQYWDFGYSGGARAVGSVVDGYYSVQINDGGTEATQIVLRQDGIELRKGRKYRLSFEGRSDNMRTIDVRLQMSFYPNTDYSRIGTVLLTQEWQNFHYEFTMEAPSDIRTKLVFNMGNSTEEIYLDNIYLKEIDLKPIIVTMISDTSYKEDSGMQLIARNLNDIFSDPDSGAALTYMVVSQNPQIQAIINDSSLFMIADSNFYGAGQLIVTATDETNMAVSDSFIVTVNNINDPPYFIDMPDSIVLSQDSSYSFNIREKIEDIDSEDSLMQFRFDSPIDSIYWTFDTLSGVFNLSALENFSGQGFLFITVTDDSGASVHDSLQVYVKPVTDNGQSQIPDHHILYQNYPNPFNSVTIIKFGLPGATEVIIELFNIRGQRVKVLLKEEKPAGYHEIHLDAAGMSSGLYFYRLQADHVQFVRKLLLLK